VESYVVSPHFFPNQLSEDLRVGLLLLVEDAPLEDLAEYEPAADDDDAPLDRLDVDAASLSLFPNLPQLKLDIGVAPPPLLFPMRVPFTSRNELRYSFILLNRSFRSSFREL